MVELAYSLQFILINSPVCSKHSNSLLMGASSTKGAFLFGLKIGVTLSLILNIALAFVHLPRLSEKISGNFIFNLKKKFSHC